MNEEPGGQLAVLLTLAAGQEMPGEGETCPGAERFVALREGSLSSKDRQALLTHLDRCFDCHRLWLRGAAHLADAASADNVIDFTRRPAPRFAAIATFALAASLLLVIVRWNPFAPDPAGMLTVAYRSAIVQGVRPFEGSAVPATALGFAPTPGPAPMRRAFLEGVDAGRKLLSGQAETAPPAMERGAELYYQLGRWTLLLQSACQAAPPPVWLRDHAAIGGALLDQLRERERAGQPEARVPRQEMEAIDRALDSPITSETAPRVCRGIRTACLAIADSLLL
ncbi:MAG: hypothetical protein HQM03_16325 [Magnetococcales bacterium]|nr:hypothetical protein [Magnetococcales bacterium]